MAVFSIHERITGWVTDQLEKEDPLGADELGQNVTMAIMQTPQGDAILWVVYITLRAPYLDQDALGANVKLKANIPPEPAVRMAVKRSVESLRKAFEIKKREGFAPGNGHSQNLPPGLKGLKL